MRDLTAGKLTPKLSDRIADVRGRQWPTQSGRLHVWMARREAVIEIAVAGDARGEEVAVSQARRPLPAAWIDKDQCSLVTATQDAGINGIEVCRARNRVSPQAVRHDHTKAIRYCIDGCACACAGSRVCRATPPSSTSSRPGSGFPRATRYGWATACMARRPAIPRCRPGWAA